MTQPSLFDGETYEPALDGERLQSQLERVRALMADGQWRTLGEISKAIYDRDGIHEAGISARLRDCRKVRHGAHIVERRRIIGGLFEYRVLPHA